MSEIITKLKKSLFNVDYNNSSECCHPCSSECKKINKKINGRELSEIKDDEISHIYKVFGI